jgi:hypothetical protein
MILLRPLKQAHRAAQDEFLFFVMAYCQLLVARLEAHEQNVDPRTRPVPWFDFPDWSVGSDILFWMLYQGHVEHFCQTTNPVSGELVFTPVLTLNLSETSSFALTKIGKAFAAVFLGDALVPADKETFAAAWDSLLLGRLVPHYCSGGERVFGWGVHVLKHFQQPSPNQELILCTAEELDWPNNWFDDPLPRRGKKNPKVHLHDTIKDLNRRQKQPYLLHFVGDGNRHTDRVALSFERSPSAPPGNSLICDNALFKLPSALKQAAARKCRGKTG